ncbi:MAG: DUF2344 domain-containing protein [Oscillospiraceae bacterium]|nr:DUF2344 domain-containing protein [Oscillospiraceae bacterium]
MSKQRLLFEKSGRAVYMSHLDLMRTMKRAFARADILLRHSEGFNPHPLISVALPLSVGQESVCELMDFELIGDMPADLISRLNAALPEGIRAAEAYEAGRKIKEIKWIKAQCLMSYDGGCTPELIEEIKGFLRADSIVIRKKTKRGEGELDLAANMELLELERQYSDTLRLELLVSAAEPTVNPALIVSAFEQLRPELVPDFMKVRRLELYDREKKVFR